MIKSLEQIDYKGIFRYFSEISAIPRGSGNERKISDYLAAFAKSQNLEYTQDEAMNVIIIKEATEGYEDEPAIILQGHMDMVCEKVKESTHDFLNDGIKIMVDGDYIHADGTTLGADNGIAIAYIMAMLSDEELPHPRIEAIITADEEVGMHGAHALDCTKLKGKYMINLDSEEEGYLLVSCAGGLRTTCSLPVNRVDGYGKIVRIKIGGLKGGHSGMDIDKNRTNASRLLGRLLFDLRESYEFGVITMQGGFKDNVIPREAEADILIGADKDTEEENSDIEGVLCQRYEAIKDKIAQLMKVYQKELATSEPELNFEVIDKGEAECRPMHHVSFEKVLFMLLNMPDGVQVMSSDIEGLVESSLNVGIFNVGEEKAEFTDSVRSSYGSYKYFMGSKLEYLISFLGGEYKVNSDYPAWEYMKDSRLREHLQRIYKSMYQKDMKVEAIHAGLECGILSEKLPGIDIVSIGPDMERVHTVDERLSISSTIRVYKFLEQIVKEKIR